MFSIAKRFSVLGLCSFGLVATACEDDVSIGHEPQEAGSSPAPSFTPVSPDGGSEAEAPTAILTCVGTSCPAPFATCTDNASFKCGTNLDRDSENCGACGNKCLVYKPIHMTSRCVGGQCELECYTSAHSFENVDWRNCNGLVDDGCEADLVSDPKNCGACGNACAAGVSCLDGKCGCPSGFIECDGECVDPNNDDFNCGGCGTRCEQPRDGCSPMPTRSYYGCRNAQCGALKCQVPSVDCNGDLNAATCGGDGCEFDRLDTNENCGACGNACGPGLECIDEGKGPECGAPCAKVGKILCGVECTDLLSDPNHCGGCGVRCKPAGANQALSCTKGLCAYECAAGFADCNDDPTDGCETNLSIHTANCGACGHSCDIGAGQPCIEGKCLMIECDSGTVAK